MDPLEYAKIRWYRVRGRSRLEGGLVAQRSYAPADRRWPRLTISVYEDRSNGILKPSVDFKRGPSAWWSRVDVPTALIGELAAVAREVEKELGRRKSEAGRDKTKGALGPRKGPKAPREKKT